jgi:hypothetical protein
VKRYQRLRSGHHRHSATRRMLCRYHPGRVGQLLVRPRLGGAESAPLTLNSSNTQTSVHGKAFLPPIQDNERNIAKYGNVVPVKVQLTNSCTGGTVTNVTLYITLAKGTGNEAIEDTNVIAESVSSADTGSQMRVVDGRYMFNLSTRNLSANTDWTVRVRLGSTTGPVLLQAVFYPKK